jgi:hypothetical protein
MKIINHTLRAVVERVTEVEWHHEGDKIRLYVFEHLGHDSTPAARWIQNWECDDVTDNFSLAEREEIYDVLKAYYKCNATK